MYADYYEYLESELWQAKRAMALDRADHRCQVCNNPERLNVHHRSYARLGMPDEERDLVVLCERCHALHHQEQSSYVFRVPDIGDRAPQTKEQVAIRAEADALLESIAEADAAGDIVRAAELLGERVSLLQRCETLEFTGDSLRREQQPTETRT